MQHSSQIITTAPAHTLSAEYTPASNIPPPPPAPPGFNLHSNTNTANRSSIPVPPPPQDSSIRKQHQPLSSISIQDLNSVQLRRTDNKMIAKNFSAPTRSISMQCLSSTNEQFLSQKIDLIAELKMSKDITGIKKMKVERAKMDDPRNTEVYSDVNRQFTMQNFVETVNVPVQFVTFFCYLLLYVSTLPRCSTVAKIIIQSNIDYPFTNFDAPPKPHTLPETTQKFIFLLTEHLIKYSHKT